MGAGASRALRDALTQQLSEFVGVLPSEDQQSLREALRHLDGRLVAGKRNHTHKVDQRIIEGDMMRPS